MKLTKIFGATEALFILIFIISGCKPDGYIDIQHLWREPVIEPDYSGVTIPVNIAPLNFIIKEDGVSFTIKARSSNSSDLKIKSKDGVVSFPVKSWKKLLKENQGQRIEIDILSEDNYGKVIEYDPVYMHVANEPIDPYLCYRLLYPGYESWKEMKIVQRSLENFHESSLFENQLLDDNCVNCHTFKQNDPGRFLLHVRGSKWGTYFVDDNEITRRTLRTEEMSANAVYPSWHPGGRYVVFSSNEVVQAFHMISGKKNEVYDQSSMLVIYDCNRNEISNIEETDTVKYMETFPCWSPCGNYLYYCRAKQIKKGFDYRNIKYDLVRKSFDQNLKVFGNAEIVFNAIEINRSVSFPRISPDGKYLVLTLHDYGTFSIWHKEADLYLLNLENGEIDLMDLNSAETESYHSWSSNGRWLVFSSKRGDGLTARPYFAYFGSPENIGKPFVLPQETPEFYKRFDKTFNIPEFVTGKIKIGPRDFARSSRKKSIKAVWSGSEK
ncbi:MAG: hypothetical protein A2X03_11160 [Bacteroidetes bacterium GWA2_40_15]|nr:MAG: hypothetical protein A2X03_11160 [Bacteroidetes bacterium GWA2_40_15]HBQ81704.1 cytochrome C biosynthesis protein [Bacteroidales bacterium]